MAKKPTGTAITNYDEELAKLASKWATLTDTGGGGKFFSTRAGVLQFDDAPLPGNQMCVVIGSWMLENVFYDGPYDPDNRTPPTCFAFCTDPDEKDEMGPHPDVDKEDVFERQADSCDGCPQNEWGSAAQGRGKACSNRRRLACLPAGTYTSAGRSGGFELTLFEDEEHFATCDAAHLKLPVMSGKGFDAYVREVSENFSRPLFAVYTRVYLAPDPKSQFKVHFEMIDKVPNELIPVLMQRNAKLTEEIAFPYAAFTEEDAPATPKAAASKKLTRGGGAKRRR